MPKVLATNLNPRAIAVDAAWIYWVSAGPNSTNDGSVEKLHKSLSAPPFTIAPPGTMAGTVEAVDAPRDIAIDGGYAYWITRTTLVRSALSGPPYTALFTAGGLIPSLLKIAMSSASAFVSLNDGLRAVPKNGDPDTIIAATSTTEVETNATHVFYIAAGTLTRAAFDGTGVTSFGVPATYLAVDDAEVVFSASSGGLSTIQWSPVGGGAGGVIYSGPSEPRSIVMNATDVYWSDDSGRITRTPRHGGMGFVLATGQGTSARLALDDAYVYWTNQTTIARVAK